MFHRRRWRPNRSSDIVSTIARLFRKRYCSNHRIRFSPSLRYPAESISRFRLLSHTGLIPSVRLRYRSCCYVPRYLPALHIRHCPESFRTGRLCSSCRCPFLSRLRHLKGRPGMTGGRSRSRPPIPSDRHPKKES